MGVVYSTRFRRISSPLGAYTVPVPAGVVWVVRDIVATLIPPASGLSQLIVYGSAGEPWVYWQVASSGITQSFLWDGRQVLNATESFQIFAGGNVQGVAVSGYQLTTP
jgi:hypothetical protein